MSKSYNRHQALGDRSTVSTPKPTLSELESLGTPYHYPPQTFGDKFAYSAVRALKPFVKAFFKEKYNHHAVVLETVAAVPGMVAGMFRHLRSLRRMQRDYGWIQPLLEEAENERMHLLIWMNVTRPTAFERVLVVGAQAFYGALYTGMYLFVPQVAHRFVGYLEEEAVRAYTEYLEAVDTGKLRNDPAPKIAIKYYKLSDDATLRHVILMVRADECMHRCLNHKFADLMRARLHDFPPNYPPDEPVSVTEKAIQSEIQSGLDGGSAALETTRVASA
jgi:ubiquinol oxidase